MKLKRKLFLITISLLASIMVLGITTNVFAKTEPDTTFGIVRLRESGYGYGYGGNPTIAGNPNVWKIVKYTDGSTIDWSNAIYCLKAEQGFASNTDGNIQKRVYNLSFDMKNERDQVTKYLNLGDNYNNVLWLLDNSYLPKQSTPEERQALLDAAGVVYDYLTDDDIEVVQQAAIWYFTNSDNPTYHRETLPELWINMIKNNDTNYTGMSDLTSDEDNKYGWNREDDAKALYTYLITAAKANAGQYSSSTVTADPITVQRTNPKLTSDVDGNHIAGPYTIKKNNDSPYTLERTVTDEKGTKITNYTVLDENKGAVDADTTLEDMINAKATGESVTFYIQIPSSKVVESVKLATKVKYSYSDIRFWTNGTSFNKEQPLAIIEKARKETPVELETPVEKFDLALRKFITGVNDTAVTNRVPVVSINNQNGNLVYTHTKEPVPVQNGDTVIYTLRIYNEGTIDGYAKAVTDDVPDGLEFLPENEINKEYRWKASSDGKSITTDYLAKEQEKTAGANLIKHYEPEKALSSTEPLNPDYRDIKIAFKVIEPNTSDRILTNTAEIADDSDKDGNPIEDIDSTPGNNVPEEDDIDVEHVKLVYFDLALRKFITGVNSLEVNNRIPQVSYDGNAGKLTYEHTKVPVEVTNGDTVIYTLRIYNEGKMDGYANKVVDDVPKGLEFLPDHEINKEYRWTISEDGKQIATDYLAKENEEKEGANLIKAFDKNKEISSEEPLNPDYRDIKIAFKVTEPNTSDRIITNTAEIADDSDKDGKPVEDVDSTPGNNVPEEDDIDVEHVKVKYFDLALRKWVTTVEITENGKVTTTETGHHAEDDPEDIVKVDLHRKKLNEVTVKFRYSIRITNEGEIAGYAKEIADYIPDGLIFNQEDNPDWKVEEGNKIVTRKLENTLLQPGESAEVEVVLEWDKEKKNFGVMNNIAEIEEDYNESGTPDIDSTPGNKKQGEDDIDDAPVMVTIELGGGTNMLYLGLGGIVLVTVAGGVFLIKKYVL
ncbi:MAG: thioester domain-containing protein [Clostridia bacterium]